MLTAEPDEIDAGFAALSLLAHEEAGLVLAPGKARMIQSRLRHRLQTLRIDSLEGYCDYVRSETDGDEKRHMISALTTNVTSFFREPHHFDQLVRECVPSMVQKLRSGKSVRIWSAGCSTGQEPYSIAMTLLNHDSIFAEADFRLLATDIDQTVLAKARLGRYPAESLATIPSETAASFDLSVDEKDNVVMPETIRNMISFKELNLMNRWPMAKKFDAVFCRNVVIYFDAETQSQLWKKFHNALDDKAIIFVGHSERITSTLFSLTGATAYRKSAQ